MRRGSHTSSARVLSTTSASPRLARTRFSVGSWRRPPSAPMRWSRARVLMRRVFQTPRRRSLWPVAGVIGIGMSHVPVVHLELHTPTSGARARSTSASAAGARSGCSPAAAHTKRSSWATGSVAGSSSAARRARSGCPTSRWMTSAMRRIGHSSSAAPCCSSRAQGPEAKCRRVPGGRRDRLLEAEELTD